MAVNPLVVKWLVIIAGGVFFVYFGLAAFGARRAIEIPRLPLQSPPALFNMEYEAVSFPSRNDNVTLKGWFFRGSRRAVIMITGGYENRVDENADTMGITGALVSKGYCVLLFDQRGRGESEGGGRALSYIDADLGGAVDYLAGQGFTHGDICMMGFCSGAASACIYATQHNIGAAILDGCFIDVPMMAVREATTYHIPSWLTRAFVPGLIFWARLFYGFRVLNPLDCACDIKCPVFFIQEELDEFITWEETQRIYQASGNLNNRIWQVGGALHSQSYRTNPSDFIEKVDDFLKKSLRVPEEAVATRAE